MKNRILRCSVSGRFDNYDRMISSGLRGFRDYLPFRLWPLKGIVCARWSQSLVAVYSVFDEPPFEGRAA